MSDHAAQIPATRPVRGAAHLAVAALGLAGAAWAVRAGWQIRLSVAGQPASGPPDQGEGRHRTLTSLEDAYHLVSTVGDIATVLCALAFVSWLWSVRDNAHALSGRPPRYSGPWVYVGWVLPIANLWVPRGIVADIHRASAPDTRLPRSVNWWWGLWLAGLISGLGLMYRGDTDDVIARAYTDLPALLFADTTVVGAAVAGIFVVRAITAVQEERLLPGVPAQG